MKNYLMLALFLLVGPLANAATRAPMDVINPVGDENLGDILVLSPQEPDPALRQLLPVSLTIDGRSAPLDQMSRVVASFHALSLVPNGYTGSSVQTITVNKGQTTTVAVSAARFTWDASQYSVNVGPTANFHFAGTLGFNYLLPASGRFLNSGTQTYVPLFADTITVTSPAIPALGTKSFTIPAGKVVDSALTFPDLRATLTIVPPSRAMPGLNCTNVADTSVMLVHRTVSTTTGRYHTPFQVLYGSNWDNSGTGGLVNAANLTSDGTKGSFYPSVDGNTQLFYELVVNNMAIPVQMKAGESKSITLKRIDVNDVLVTRENNSTYYAHGSYQIFTEIQPGVFNTNPLDIPWHQSCNANLYSGITFPTKTGVDVIPGRYKVVVSYSTEEGPKAQVYQLDLT